MIETEYWFINKNRKKQIVDVLLRSSSSSVSNKIKEEGEGERPENEGKYQR